MMMAKFSIILGLPLDAPLPRNLPRAPLVKPEMMGDLVPDRGGHLFAKLADALADELQGVLKDSDFIGESQSVIRDPLRARRPFLKTEQKSATRVPPAPLLMRRIVLNNDCHVFHVRADPRR